MKLQLGNSLLFGLKGYWKFDGSLGYAKDEIAGNNGTLTNVIQDASGKIGSGFSFNGSAKAVANPIATFEGKNNYTFSAWINLNTSTGTLGVFGNSDAGGNNIVAVDYSGTLRFVTYSGGYGTIISTALTPGIWYHIVITKNGTTGTIYIDNLYKNAGTIKEPTSMTSLSIGSRENGAYGFNGLIDEVGIWTRALSTSEISKLYNGGNGLSHNFKFQNLVSTSNTSRSLQLANLLTGLQSYYKMDGSLGYAKDYGPYGRDASIVGQITQDASGIVGTGFRWDSSTTTASYVKTPACLFGDKQLSFNVWIVPDSSTTQGTRTLFGDAAQSGTVGFVWIYQSAAQHLKYYYSNGVGGTTTVTAISYFLGYYGTWVMVTITVDYMNKIVKMYRNGTLISQTTVADTMLFPSTSRARYIGNYNTTNLYGWNSNLDEFGIWSRVLSADEVAQLYNGGLGRQHPFLGQVNRGPALKLQPELCNALVAYYKLDGSLGYAKDEINNQNITLNATVAQDSSGKICTGLQFNGSTSFGTFPAGLLNFAAGQDFSISFWAKRNGDSDTVYPGLVGHGGSSDTTKGFNIRLNTTTGFLFQMSNGTTRVSYSIDDVFNLEEWKYVTVTCDRDGLMNMYVDGAVQGAGINISSHNVSLISATNNFGRWTSASYFNGNVDELGIWKRVLTPTDVSTLYNNGLGKTYPFKIN